MLMKMSEYEFVGGENGGDEDKVTEWEVGLPSVDDLTLLPQLLIPPELGLAFSILPEPYRTAVEGSLFETTDPDLDPDQDLMVVEADENEIINRDGFGSDPKRSRKDDECCVEIEVEEADSALRNNENNDSADSQTWWISATMID
nr:transcription factor lux [Quercus suber]